MDYYRKPINKVVNDVKLKMQLGALTLKLNENNNKIDDLIGVDKNIKKDISTNSGLIGTNTSNISDNLEKINDIENEIFIEPYNETFILSNRETTSSSQLIFEKIINFDFSKGGFFNILTICNDEYDTKYNFSHSYRFYNNNNNELIKREIIPHNMVSNVVKDKFKFESIDTSSLKIVMYIAGNYSYKKIKLLGDNSLQFKYNEIKSDINENNIKSNLKTINDNSGLISTNIKNISSNLKKINDLQNSNIKAFYNLDQIFIYDIEKGNQNVDKNNHYHIFEKEITYNFIKNSYLEIALKVLTEISNYVLIGFFQILCNFYDQDDNLFYTISLSTAMGSINRLSTIKSVFIVPINKNMSKIKIDFFIAPKETQQNRSAQFTIKDINSNKIYLKYFQKTDEMSIKDIQDALDNGKNINSEQVNTNTTDIADNFGKIGINTEQINKNTIDIADNLGKIGINTVSISNNLNEINNITKTIMLKNIYFTDFDSIERSFTNELLYFDHKDIRNLSATIKHLNMEYSFKKDDFIEIDCKLMISHNSYEDSKNNLSLYYSLYNKNLDEDNLLFKERRDYSDFPLFNENRSIITYVKICYKVKYDTSNIIFTVTIQSKHNKLHLLLYHHIIEHGVNYISIKHYGKS